MSPRRRLPAGIRGRGSVVTYTWRDAAGRQYSRDDRNAGENPSQGRDAGALGQASER